MQLSKYVRRSLKAILFIAIFIMLTIILDSSFELDESATENMLVSYSETADIDTVFVGNSAGEMLDAKQFSKLTGEKAFNMCTPSQGLSVSLKNIKLACSQHKIKRVFILMTDDTVNSDDYDGIDHVYDRVVNSGSPFSVRLKNLIARDLEKSFSYDTLKTEKSVNIWIPWENETIHGFENIWNNLKKRASRFIKGDRLGSRFAYDLNTKVYDVKPDYLTDDDISLLENDIRNADLLSIPPDMLGSDKLSLLARICAFCRNNDIKLMIIITPHRTDYYDRYDSFREYNDVLNLYLDDFISKRGFMYYNTEDDPQLHDLLPDNYFYDWEHISNEYKDQATSYLADVIRKLK